MALTDISFPKAINTGSSSAIEHLFIPALKEACEYNVAVAYFTSGWISDAAPGLSSFVSNGGRLRWIISPDLKDEDIEAIYSANTDEEKEAIAWRSTEVLLSKMTYQPREALKWMISDRILEIRLAVPRQGRSGIFHAKLGFFKDTEDGLVAFSGSYNQTAGANNNWERIDIYQGNSEPDRAQMIVDDWNRLWNNQDSFCQAARISEITITKIKNSITSERPYEISWNSAKARPLVQLRPYQEDAISQWFTNKGRGIFLMATGSGKTITALSLLSRLHEKVRAKSSKLVVVICVPYRHLLDQWTNEAALFGFDLVKCYESKTKWIPEAQASLANLKIGAKDIAILATTYTTLCKDEFQEICKISDLPFLFIGDEIHNAAEGTRNLKLPDAAQFRLGLTATPEKSSEAGIATENLQSYFGDILINFDIQDAITKGYLTPYEYHPIPCRMDDSEFEQYVDISKKISKLLAAGEDEREEALKQLLMKRARLLGDISDKYSALAKLLAKAPSTSKAIIYAGDYSASDVTPVEKCAAVANSAGRFTQKFTHIESTAERSEIIRQLTEGKINTAVAIRCLDEGVDIPSVDSAYLLASSTSFRQFIQRRGRVLRLSPGKSKALIYDFVAYPPHYQSYSDDETRAIKSLCRRELERAKEFARLSLNAHSCLKTIKEMEEMEKSS